jgi:transcriptional regulator with XRE-family HTH domain
MARKKTTPTGPRTNFIFEWRERAGLTMAELAEATISRIENGATDFMGKRLEAIASALDLRTWQLLMHPSEADEIADFQEAANRLSRRAADRRIDYHAPDVNTDIQPIRPRPRK